MKLMWYVFIGKFYEYGSDEYRSFIPEDTRLPGSRAVIVVDIHKVGTVRLDPHSFRLLYLTSYLFRAAATQSPSINSSLNALSS